MRVEIIFDEYALSINKDFTVETELSIAAEAAAARAEAAAQRAEGQPLYSDQLRSDVYAEDSTPYLYRPSYSGDREYDTLVGGSVGWNQLCNASSVTVRSGHKYYMVKGGTRSLGSSTGSAITGLTSGTDIVVDLTLLLGSSLADYLYTLESGSAGAGVAMLKKWGFCTKDYYPYDAGSLLSVQTSAHEMVGKNFCQKLTAGTASGLTLTVAEDGVATLNGTPTGTGITAGDVYFSLPAGSYIASGVSSSANFSLRVYNVDASSTLANVKTTNPEITFTLTETTNVRVFIRTDTVGTASSLVFYPMIRLATAEEAPQYKPYVKHTYPLDSSLTLRGVPKKDSNNNFYYDGDTYSFDGTVTRKYGIVDLGTLSWTLNSSYPLFQVNVTGMANGVANAIPNIKDTEYAVGESGTNANINSNNADKTITVRANSNVVIVKDSGYSDAATFKTAMSGVHLVYELATPTTETADPYTELQIVDEHGTEEYIDTRTVPVPVGHNTKYPTNQVAKLDGLPADFSTLIAPTEKTYKATRAYTSGSLLIVNNILYKATASISSGATLTVGTNITATTLAQVIAAL